MDPDIHSYITQGRGNKSDIDQRCAQLKDQIEETNSEYEREKLQERLARLASGVGVLKVGGSSEVRTAHGATEASLTLPRSVQWPAG